MSFAFKSNPAKAIGYLPSVSQEVSLCPAALIVTISLTKHKLINFLAKQKLVNFLMTDWLSFCYLFAFGFSSLSSDEWQNKYWNWNNSIQTFILPSPGPRNGRATSYYIIIQFDMLHDYANVCLLVVFLFFFNSPLSIHCSGLEESWGCHSMLASVLNATDTIGWDF